MLSTQVHIPSSVCLPLAAKCSSSGLRSARRGDMRDAGIRPSWDPGNAGRTSAFLWVTVAIYKVLQPELHKMSRVRVMHLVLATVNH